MKNMRIRNPIILMIIGIFIKIIGLYCLIFIGDDPLSFLAYFSPLAIIIGIILISVGFYKHAINQIKKDN